MLEMSSFCDIPGTKSMTLGRFYQCYLTKHPEYLDIPKDYKTFAKRHTRFVAFELVYDKARVCDPSPISGLPNSYRMKQFESRMKEEAAAGEEEDSDSEDSDLFSATTSKRTRASQTRAVKSKRGRHSSTSGSQSKFILLI
jgi:hypothetical protein